MAAQGACRRPGSALARRRHFGYRLGAVTAITLAGVATAGFAGASGADAAASRIPAASAATAQAAIVPPHNPARSLAPVPNFLTAASCRAHSDGQPCNSVVLKAIARGRKTLENLGGMSFSLAAYEKLTRNQQLFVTVNLERTARGLRPVNVLTRSLNKVAQGGANRSEDPPLGTVPRTLPGGGQVVELGGNWAGGLYNALGADYAWMYWDGLGSGNLSCTKASTSGCWGHRDNILARFNGTVCGGRSSAIAMGAGYTAASDSQTELFADVCGHTPTDVVMTWAKAKSLLHIKS